MPTAARVQQRYDHRLRNLVRRTGDVTVATVSFAKIGSVFILSPALDCVRRYRGSRRGCVVVRGMFLVYARLWVRVQRSRRDVAGEVDMLRRSQAARRSYRWWRPPTSGNSTTRPSATS